MAFNLFDFSKLGGVSSMITPPQSAQNLGSRERILPTISGKPLPSFEDRTSSVDEPVISSRKSSIGEQSSGKLSVADFAKKIKEKYPVYTSVDDATLTQKMIDKYPVYREMVDMKVEAKQTFGKNVAGGFLENLPADVSSTATGLTPLLRSTPIVEPIENAINTVGNLAGLIPGEFGKEAKKYIKKLNLSTVSDKLDKMASEVGTQLSNEAVGKVDKDSSGYKTGRVASFATSLLAPGGMLEKETAIPSTIAKSIKKAPGVIGEKLPSVGKIVKPKSIVMPEGLTKSEQNAAEILHPKEFTPTELAIAKGEKKFKSANGLGKDWGSFVPDKGDIEIYKTASPYLKKGATSTDNIISVENAIAGEGKLLETTIAKENPVFPKKQINGHIQKVVDDVMDNPEMVGESKQIAQNLVNKYKSMLNEEGGSALGVLRARKRFDAYIKSVKPKSLGSTTGNVYDSVVRTIRTGANDFLDSAVTNTSAKASLRKQNMLYKARDMLTTQTDQSMLGKILTPLARPAFIGTGLAGAGAYEVFKQ